MQRGLLTACLVLAVLLAGCDGLGPKGREVPVGATVQLAGWDVHVAAVGDRVGRIVHGGAPINWVVYALVHAVNVSAAGGPVRVYGLWDDDVGPEDNDLEQGIIAREYSFVNLVHPTGPVNHSHALPQGELAVWGALVGDFHHSTDLRVGNLEAVRVAVGNASVVVPVPDEAVGDPAPERDPPAPRPTGEPFAVGEDLQVTVRSVEWLEPADPGHWDAWAAKPRLQLQFDVEWLGNASAEVPVPKWRVTNGLGAWWQPREDAWRAPEPMAPGDVRHVNVTAHPGLDPHPESGRLWAYVAAGPADAGVAVAVPPAPAHLR